MKTSNIIWLIIAVIAVWGVWQLTQKAVAPATTSSDYKNSTYSIEEQSVTLVNGRAEVASAPGSVSKIITQYFGNDATGDVNGDGMSDVAFVLTQNTGGSGTFYYAVVALKTADSYQGTNGVLLGDRIAPQTTEIKNGQVVVNYAVRNDTEPMTAQPSVGMTKYLKVTGVTLSETNPVVSAGEHCGGNRVLAALCNSSSHCAAIPGSHLPFGDVGGICVAN